MTAPPWTPEMEREVVEACEKATPGWFRRAVRDHGFSCGAAVMSGDVAAAAESALHGTEGGRDE